MGVCLLVNAAGLAEKTTLMGAFLKRKMQEYQELNMEIESLCCNVQRQEATKQAEDKVVTLNDDTTGIVKFKIG